MVLFFILSQLPFLFCTEDDPDDYMNIGGAVRYKVARENFESDPIATNTYATWDKWRLNVNAENNQK